MNPRMMEYLAGFESALRDARAHARSEYPREACGVIVDGKYLPMTNLAADPSLHREGDMSCECALCSFRMSERAMVEHDVQAVVHSHPGGPAHPSQADMQQQLATDVAWIILTLDEERDGPAVAWGGDCPRENLIGRHFIHGIADCYEIIRDVFALGRESMAAQGMDWPLDPIELPQVPRDDAWWLKEHDDLYESNFRPFGFTEIAASEARPGDVFLGRINSNRLNHGGVLLGGNLILHHLPNRLSRREPAGIWARAAEKWIRYTGEAR